MVCQGSFKQNRGMINHSPTAVQKGFEVNENGGKDTEKRSLQNPRGTDCKNGHKIFFLYPHPLTVSCCSGSVALDDINKQ